MIYRFIGLLDITNRSNIEEVIVLSQGKDKVKEKVLTRECLTIDFLESHEILEIIPIIVVDKGNFKAKSGLRVICKKVSKKTLKELKDNIVW